MLQAENNNRVLQIIALYTFTIFVYKDFGIPTAAGFLFIMLALLCESYRTDISFRVNSLSSAFFLLSAFQIVQIVRAVWMGNTNQIMYIPALLLLSACVSLSKASEKTVIVIVKIWLCLNVALSLYVVAVTANESIYYRLVAPFLTAGSQEMNRNLLAKGYGIAIGGNVIIIDYFIAFGALFCISSLLINRNGSTQKRLKYIAMLLLFLLTAVLINRKTEMISLVLSAGILFFSKAAFVSKKRSARNRRYLLYLIPVAVLFVLILYKTGRVDRYVEFAEKLLLNRSGLVNNDISSGRMTLWIIALELFVQYPFLGIGWGMFSEYVPDNVQLGLINEIHNVHNCYLQVLCETGIVGFAIMYGLMFYILYTISKRSVVMHQNGAGDLLRVINTTCFAYQLFFLISGAIDPTFYSLIFWCLYSLTIMMSDAAINNCNNTALQPAK